jgi:hypothetical protein
MLDYLCICALDGSLQLLAPPVSILGRALVADAVAQVDQAVQGVSLTCRGEGVRAAEGGGGGATIACM